MPPSPTHGKICYLQIPATDIETSAEFYRRAFGWRIRQDGRGHTAFEDAAGAVSGSWILGRPPSFEPGLLIYVMVDSVADTLETIAAIGGRVVQPIGGDAGEITARVLDPGGNLIGLYQEPEQRP